MRNVYQREKEWFVLYTRPKFEKKIAREISLRNCENYLPLRTIFRKWSDRIKRVEEPLFPNYIFVKILIAEGHKVLSADGAIRLISFEGRPVTIDEKLIDKIKKIEFADNDILHECLTIAGEKVKVVKGIFIGMEGELVCRAKGSRLLIRLPLLNQAVSVEMSAAFVEKIA